MSALVRKTNSGQVARLTRRIQGRRIRDRRLQQHQGVDSASAGAGGAGYRRHRPEDTVLYGVVEQHADAFFEGQVEQGRGLPRFVREEFEAYLRCGRLEHGFIGAKCSGCRHEH